MAHEAFSPSSGHEQTPKIGEAVSLGQAPKNAVFSIENQGFYMRVDDGRAIPLGYVKEVASDGMEWQDVKFGAYNIGGLLIGDGKVVIVDFVKPNSQPPVTS